MTMIAENNLRKIVREMLLEATAGDIAAVKGTTAASQGAAAVTAGIPMGLQESFSQFIVDLLDGKTIVTKSKNSTTLNLFVREFLSYYWRKYTGMDAALEDKIGIGTSYPESAVKYVQKTIPGLQVDGDFGRQTMAALVTGGKVIMTPTHIQKMKDNPNAKKLIATIIKNAVNRGTDAEGPLQTALAAKAPPPGAPQELAGEKRTDYANFGKDAPGPAVRTAAAGSVSAGEPVKVDVKRPPMTPMNPRPTRP